MDDNTAFLSATKLAALIQAGSITSLQLTNHFIERIQRLDLPTTTNAVIIRTFESARKRAKECDEFLANGIILGPLHGVPITVKENNDVEGLPSTLGNPARANHIASNNSPPIQRMLDAGAVLLGKTNCPLDLNDVQTYNVIYGSTSNPHDLRRTPGGSSGGSAAALAAGLTSLEFGGDIGGSIRTPAHCCGIFGHKATLGAIPLGYGPRRRADIVVKGPMARTAEDLDLVMRLVTQVEGPAKRALTINLPECEKKCLSEFRVCVWGDDACCPVDADVRRAVERVVSELRRAGCAVVDLEARPNLPGGASGAFEIYKRLLASEENQGIMSIEEKEKMWKEYQDRSLGKPSSSMKGEMMQRGGESRKALQKQYKWITQSHQEWHEADRIRQAMRVEWEKFFKSFDVLLLPICSSVAWPHDQDSITDQPFWKIGRRVIPGADGHQTLYHQQVFWSGLTNVCGNPSTVFPAGRAESMEGRAGESSNSSSSSSSSSSSIGMPVGLQVMAAEWNDLTCIRFVRALEEEAGFGFLRPHDGLSSSSSSL